LGSVFDHINLFRKVSDFVIEGLG